MNTWDIFSVDHIPLGSLAHAMLLDLLAACRDERQERVLHLRLNGATQEDISRVVEFGQQEVSRCLAGIYRRAGVKDGIPEVVAAKVRIRPGFRGLAAEYKHGRPSGLRFPKHERGYARGAA